MFNVPLKGGRAADRRARGKLRSRGIIGHLAKPQQIQHDDAALHVSRDEGSSGFLGRF
jgi:hypothetical protein